MGKKSIICPKCGKLGTLVSELRTKKIQKSNRKKTNWELWEEYGQKFHNLSEIDLKRKIYEKTNRLIENIPTKKYQRKRNPIFKVVHTVKKNGESKQIRHYLGINPWAKIMDYVDQHQLDVKIELENIKKLILDNNGEIIASDNQTTNQLIAEVINLKNFLYSYRISVIDGLKNFHMCPHCNNSVNISVNTHEFKLIKTPKKQSDPIFSKKKKN